MMTSVTERATAVRGSAYCEESRPHGLARPILVAFLFTFMAARVLVFLIVARRIPDLYLNLGGTHVRHLNYGIFLLSGVGAYLLVDSLRYADRLLLRIQIVEQSGPRLR